MSTSAMSVIAATLTSHAEVKSVSERHVINRWISGDRGQRSGWIGRVHVVTHRERRQIVGRFAQVGRGGQDRRRPSQRNSVFGPHK
jgi:hypothetical protein